MSKPDLEAYAREHIRYEVQMLLATAQEWPKYYQANNWAVSNALHNSFAIHARNLDHFLSSKEGVKANDDYGVTINWPEPSWRKQINRKVAHLLPGRKPGNDPSDAFDMQTIVMELGVGLHQFYNALPLDKKYWFAVIPECFPKQDPMK